MEATSRYISLQELGLNLRMISKQLPPSTYSFKYILSMMVTVYGLLFAFMFLMIITSYTLRGEILHISILPCMY